MLFYKMVERGMCVSCILDACIEQIDVHQLGDLKVERLPVCSEGIKQVSVTFPNNDHY